MWMSFQIFFFKKILATLPYHVWPWFPAAAAASAKSLQSCSTLCDSIDGSPPGSIVPGILQARTLEWVAISFSNAGKWKVKVKSLSHVWFLMTPWTAAHQAPLSMGFSRQEYWSGLPMPSLKEGSIFQFITISLMPSLGFTTQVWCQMKNSSCGVWVAL